MRKGYDTGEGERGKERDMMENKRNRGGGGGGGGDRMSEKGRKEDVVET